MSQVLVIASDIARYGFGTAGEATQGCGAVAFIVKSEPRLLVIHPEAVVTAKMLWIFGDPITWIPRWWMANILRLFT